MLSRKRLWERWVSWGFLSVDVLSTRHGQAVQGEWWISQRPQRQLQEREFLVVTRDAVRAQGAAAGAAVDDGPLAIVSDVDTDRFHRGPAARSTVAGLLIDVS